MNTTAGAVRIDRRLASTNRNSATTAGGPPNSTRLSPSTNREKSDSADSHLGDKAGLTKTGWESQPAEPFRRTWSEGMREVLAAAERRDEWTTAEIASAVDLSTQQVREHLHRLVDDGVVSCEYDGSGYVWRDDGLHRVNENGSVELDPVADDELGGDESAEVGRNSVYSWDFRGHAGSDAKETTTATTTAEDTARTPRGHRRTGERRLRTHPTDAD